MPVENVRSIRRAKARPRYLAADGELLPGVTTITKMRAAPALINWAFNVARENPDLSSLDDYTDDLARIGSCSHSIIQGHLLDSPADLSDYSQNEIDAAKVPVNKFFEWTKGKALEVVAAEQMVISEMYRYGGTYDLYAKIDGKFSLIDWKTGRSGIYDEHRRQGAAYAEALAENGQQVDEIRIVRIGRDASEGFAEERMAEWRNHWYAFLALRQLYDIELCQRQGVLWAPRFGKAA